MEHLRRIYRRQWYESYRINADEYLSVYAKTKAAQYMTWQSEILMEEKKRREYNWKMTAARQLGRKQSDMWREYSEKKFFYWYERASERIHQMSLFQWLRREDLGSHIETQLDKYLDDRTTKSQDMYGTCPKNVQSEGSYPLNFVGQMPLLEDKKGNIVSTPMHMKQYYDINTKSLKAGERSALDEPVSTKVKKQFSQRTSIFDPPPCGHYLAGISQKMHTVTLDMSPDPCTQSISTDEPKCSQGGTQISIDEESDSNENDKAEKVTPFEAASRESYELKRHLKDRGGPFVKTK